MSDFDDLQKDMDAWVDEVFNTVPNEGGLLEGPVGTLGPIPKVCECGSAAAKLPTHSDWCPLYEPQEE